MGEKITLDELSAKLEEAGENVRKNMEKAINKCCLLVVDEAKRNCTPGSSPYDTMIFRKDSTRARRSGAPFDTGALRRSITGSVTSDNKTITASIGSNMDYAAYVHEGTSRMQGRPFLTDAISAEKSRIQGIMQAAGADGLKETCRTEYRGKPP